MKHSPSQTFVSAGLCIAVALSLSSMANAQTVPNWEAFNDHAPDVTTDPNATGHDMQASGGPSPLKNIVTGEDLSASLIVTLLGANPNFGANSPVNAGSPADRLFGGKVTIGNTGIPGVDGTPADTTKVTLTFSGLDLTKRYKFRGTTSRGGNYNDRWTLFTLTNTTGFAAAHEDGSANLNIISKTTYPAALLEPSQAALNSGDNKVGSLVGWDNIEPTIFMLEDGTEVTGFSIVAEQYLGVAPFGNPANGPYGYGFSAIYLAEVNATGNLRITENPLSQKIPAGKTATFTVAATSTLPITYQWQRAAPGGATFENITGATQASYTTPTLIVADDGAKFRCQLSSGGDRATSGEATMTVDGVIPTVVRATGSVNFNSVYVTFSEAMKLDTLVNSTNYQISGGLSITSAIALDSANARLLTSTQSVGTTYSVTINNIEDIAGNKVANSTLGFTAFSLTTNTVGLEIWKNIGGGAVTDLRNDARYPSEPDVDYATSTFDSFLVIPAVPDNNTYGGRFRAWLTPDEGGEYEFFLRADDQGEFRISMDDKFDNLDDPNITPDAVDTTAGDTFQEPGFDLSTSVPIILERDKKYAVQAIWKESNGNDYCQVAWRKVGDLTPADQLQPIPSKFLSYYGPVVAPQLPKINAPAIQGGMITITWSEGGTLWSSPSLNGPWTTTGDSDGSYSETVTGPGKYFRVQK